MGKTDGIRYGLGQFDGLPIFAPPEPPTGPRTDVALKFGDPDGEEYRRYVAWKQTEAGRRVWGYVEQVALVKAEQGAERIGMKNLAEKARHSLKLDINNTWVSWISDDLVARHPHLEDLIERRARRKAKV